MVKETTAIAVIIVVVVLVLGGTIISLAPRFMDWASDFLDTGIGGLGADNQAELTWYIGLPDGTEEDISDPLNVFYGSTEISFIGFRTQVKLSYTGEISTMHYDAQVSLSFDGEEKQTLRTGQQISKNIGASGAWFGLVSLGDEDPAGLTVDARTIESWGDIGEHTLGAEVTVTLHIVRGDSTTESVSGTASGTATISIDSDPVTLETRVSTITISVFPTTLR